MSRAALTGPCPRRPRPPSPSRPTPARRGSEPTRSRERAFPHLFLAAEDRRGGAGGLALLALEDVRAQLEPLLELVWVAQERRGRRPLALVGLRLLAHESW